MQNSRNGPQGPSAGDCLPALKMAGRKGWIEMKTKKAKARKHVRYYQYHVIMA